MEFSHPLARQSRVWTTAGVNGQEQKVLLVITTLALDPASKKFSAQKVRQLNDAAKEWLAANGGAAADFMLINRAKEW